jgi:nucleotide-binding universal stress UspA family protein
VKESLMRKILVATDFSPHSDAALELALDLAQHYDASLTLLHVCHIPSYVFFGGGAYVPSPELTDDILDDAQRALTQARERAAQSGVAVETHALLGEPAADIVRFAHEHKSDLIVVGTHGRRGLGRLVLGSVAERVVRTADVPVLTARARPAAEGAAGAA